MSAAERFFMDEPAKIDPLKFSPETQALLDALAEDDDEKIVAFTEVRAREIAEDAEPVADEFEVQDEDEQTSSPADW